MNPIPTRAAGLARLHQFLPQAGRFYAEGRNTEPAEGPGAVSQLSPYLRRRLITETEVIAAALEAHGEAAAGFVQQVAWRSYYKGWLEQHPAAWTGLQDGLHRDGDRLATEAGLRERYHDACEGRTGIACFDAWAQALVAEGWLHNHARMWFASIWLFTLRLPLALGAAFFLRHLLDGDPASNTLSWRWVAGLQTPGKHYVARAENIARYTDGRFHPVGALDETPEPLTEREPPQRVRVPDADLAPDGVYDLLLHDDDLNPESLGLDLGRARRIAMLPTASAAAPVMAFALGAAQDCARRLDRDVGFLAPGDIAGWIAGAAHPVVCPYAPVGPNATLLSGQPILRVRRDWDSSIWPHSAAGYFALRKRLPELMVSLARA